jgi:CMP-N-acetylneuraminic acid synthetase
VRPAFEPLWLTVVERDGLLVHAFPDAKAHDRRQDVPEAFMISGALYLWRAEFVRGETESWQSGRLRLVEQRLRHAVDVDDEEDLRLAEALLAAGLVALPWLLPREPHA